MAQVNPHKLLRSEVYLGHAHLADTQVYLTMTPEVLHQTGTLFERYARGEDRHA